MCLLGALGSVLVPLAGMAQQRSERPASDAPLDSPPPAPDGHGVPRTQRMAARSAYARGQAAYAEGDFETALRAFREAHRIMPNPIVLRSIAAAEEHLGRIPDAIAHLSAFLEATPKDDEGRPEVEDKLAELRRRPGMLRLKVSPEDADIFVDDRQASVRNSPTIQLSPGPHQISVATKGYSTTSREVEIVPGGQQTLTVALVKLPDPVEVAPSPYVGPAADGADPTALLVAGGVGLAALVTGSVLGFMALSENSDFDANPTRASADRGERLALLSDVSFGVAGMALVTGAVLYMTQDTGEARDPRDRDGDGIVQLRFGITPARGGGVAAAAARF